MFFCTGQICPPTCVLIISCIWTYNKEQLQPFEKMSFIALYLISYKLYPGAAQNYFINEIQPLGSSATLKFTIRY